MNIKIVLVVIIVLVIGIFGYLNKSQTSETTHGGETMEENFPQKFKNKGLNTDTSKASIPLDKILDGGPGKDGIPALTNPKFVNVQESEIDGGIDGLVVSVGETTKFYPYSIMVWHEIVNDVIENKPLTVTFCPLCGSAIVFEVENGDRFGVSGKLYESNLLMYDKATESLWSQSIGKAVVGDRLGEELEIYPSQLMTFEKFKNKWPDGKVMSTDTGHRRDYSFYPYGNYDNSEEIFFPVSVEDKRFPAKEIMFIVSAYDKSIAFPIKQLSESPVSVDIGGKKVTAVIIDGETVVKDAEGNTLAGYHEMWFSWATHHQENGVVLGK